jgi:NADPH:quinone reductase-like Zn-dependent oxidoreductase
MKVVRIEGHDGLASLRLAEVNTPKPGPGQVLVKMRAAALNRVDLYMAGGGAGVTHALPLTLGLDGAGEVADGGDSGLKVDTKVVLYPGLNCGRCEFCNRGDHSLCQSYKVFGEQVDGTFCEYMAVPAQNCVALPDDADLVQAACLPTAYLTAWRMLFSRARLQPGEDVLIFGVGGGVSAAAMQLARLAGARVLVTSRSRAKLDSALDLGATVAIDGTGDIRAQVLKATNGRGVDVVIDNVGTATFGIGARCLVRGGRLVSCGATTGGEMGNLLQLMFIRHLAFFGSSLGGQAEFRALVNSFAQGNVVPLVDATYPLDQAAAAYAYLDSDERMGKVVLTLGN